METTSAPFWLRALGLTLALGLLAGCAASRQDVQQFQEDHGEFRARLVKMDDRLDRIENDLDILMGLLGDDLNASLRAMRADQSANNLELERRFLSLTERLEDNERRLTRLMGDLEGIHAALQQSLPGQEGPIENDARALYDQSLAELTRGDYDIARLGFQQLLGQFGESELADDALYGIGETHLAEERADSAQFYFEAVESRFPESNRMPVTLLKRGILAEEEGDVAQARRMFRRVIREYPASQEAEQAELRLSAL